MSKPIPVSAGKQIAQEYDYSQVIIVAWDKKTNIQHVTTYGVSRQDCLQAAQGGNFVKQALGWPEELCNEKPKKE